MYHDGGFESAFLFAIGGEPYWSMTDDDELGDAGGRVLEPGD